MTIPKLTYFDFVGSRGEECRLALVLSSVEFEDERISKEQWAAVKPTVPFQVLPILTIGERAPIFETNAILGLVGRNHGLLPKEDEFESARLLGLLSAGESLRHAIAATFRIDSEKELAEKRAEIVSGPLRVWGESMEAQVRGPWISGDQISVADVKAYVLVGWIKKGVLSHIPSDSLDRFPKLNAIYEGVKSHPKVVAFYGE